MKGQHYLALQFGCECELRSDCSKAVPVEKLCFLPIELGPSIVIKHDVWQP